MVTGEAAPGDALWHWTLLPGCMCLTHVLLAMFRTHAALSLKSRCIYVSGSLQVVGRTKLIQHDNDSSSGVSDYRLVECCAGAAVLCEASQGHQKYKGV